MDSTKSEMLEIINYVDRNVLDRIKSNFMQSSCIKFGGYFRVNPTVYDEFLHTLYNSNIEELIFMHDTHGNGKLERDVLLNLPNIMCLTIKNGILMIEKVLMLVSKSNIDTLNIYSRVTERIEHMLSFNHYILNINVYEPCRIGDFGMDYTSWTLCDTKKDFPKTHAMTERNNNRLKMFRNKCIAIMASKTHCPNVYNICSYRDLLRIIAKYTYTYRWKI